jgi:ribosomal protein L37AE/L43A
MAWVIIVLVVGLVWLFGRELFYARQKCPHCGKTGVQPEPGDDRLPSGGWVCDHCGKTF